VILPYKSFGTGELILIFDVKFKNYIMTHVEEYLDSTYLKTPQQSGLTEAETKHKVKELTEEAIANHFYAVMIRPDYVKYVKDYIKEHLAEVKVGTVIGFHEGTASIEAKYREAEKAIEDGADELDFVINFEAYKKGDTDLVKKEFLECTKLGLDHGKVVKWIIEIAALTDTQIADLTSRIRDWAEVHFAGQEDKIFVKSSTGFYKTENGKPNGANPEAIKIMIANAGPLPVKAAGGVRTHEEALEMIRLGVKRIGTSSAKALAGISETSEGGY